VACAALRWPVRGVSYVTPMVSPLYLTTLRCNDANMITRIAVHVAPRWLSSLLVCFAESRVAVAACSSLRDSAVGPRQMAQVATRIKPRVTKVDEDTSQMALCPICVVPMN